MIMCNLKYALFSMVFLPVIFVSAQETFTCETVLDSLIEPKLIGDVYQSPLLVTSVGSQFFKDDWLHGDIYLSNNNIVKNKVLKYNAFLDMLILNSPFGYQQVKLDKGQIEGFCLHGRLGETYCFKKIPVRYDLTSDSVDVFGEVLYENNISLYAYRKVVTDGYDESISAYYRKVYKLKTHYFLRMENGKTLGCGRHKKHDIVALFPEKKEMIIAKFREIKQLRFRTEADLINITRILNEVL